MKKIGIIRCHRYHLCSGAGCFTGINSLTGPMSPYRDEGVQVVGYTTCGGCPGYNMEKAPEALKRAGAEVIHLSTCFLCGVPPCIHLREFVRLVEAMTGLPVVVGTHLFPKTYQDLHVKLGDWKELGLMDLAEPLMKETEGQGSGGAPGKKGERHD